ncbi:MAG: hypothetical protein VB038_04030 [Methanobrevibacter sp.]|uniref:hypothetical protein n=1 Tax=Methanobrevibacter sp. TaxID=66852 RepID=UPI002B1FBAAB|nr:hypothetical protein [Methanobrevibacter sp.]MEA4956873.1 hypothetical protein [Methanobrevibacter sp.]
MPIALKVALSIIPFSKYCSKAMSSATLPGSSRLSMVIFPPVAVLGALIVPLLLSVLPLLSSLSTFILVMVSSGWLSSCTLTSLNKFTMLSIPR